MMYKGKAKLSLKDATGIPKKKSFCRMSFVVGLAFGVGWCLMLSMIPTSCVPKTKGLDCRECHGRSAALEKYFEQSGSKVPKKMAEAVLKTSRPKLMAAIAKVETGGNPSVRNTGYKHRHSGAFQISREWGPIPKDPVEQALQAELVLETHIKEEKSVVKGLNAYGGESDKKRGRYAYNVLAELKRVP